MSNSRTPTGPLAMEHYFEYPFEQRVSPSAERNKEPILQQVRNLVDGWQHKTELHFLEVGSGTGQHAGYISEALPQIKFLPSEFEKDLLGSIYAWTSDLKNVEKPIVLDAGSDWKLDRKFQLVMTCNLAHITPWECTCGLFRGAAAHLHPGGILFMYGPFLKNGVEMTQSNVNFNAELKAQNSLWGYRDIAVMETEAAKSGLRMRPPIDMPANNFVLLFQLGE